MCKFLTEQEVYSPSVPPVTSDIDNIFRRLRSPKGRRTISGMSTTCSSLALRKVMRTNSVEEFREFGIINSHCCKPLAPIYEYVMEESDLLSLKSMMSIVYPHFLSSSNFSMVCQKMHRLEIGGEIILWFAKKLDKRSLKGSRK